MAKKSEISSKKLPPHTKDIEVNRALTQVYKDINELVESVNLFKGKEADDNSEGKEGDVKVVKSPQSKEYSLQIYGEDGWLEDKTAKYVPINALVDIKQEQKKKTIPSHLGGLFPPPDYDSGWLEVTDHATVGTHNLGAFPSNYQVLWSLEGDDDANITTIYYKGINYNNRSYSVAFTRTNWSINGGWGQYYTTVYTDITGSTSTNVQINYTDLQADLRVRMKIWK